MPDLYKLANHLKKAREDRYLHDVIICFNIFWAFSKTLWDYRDSMTNNLRFLNRIKVPA